MKKGIIGPSKSASISVCATKNRTNDFPNIRKKSKASTSEISRKTKSFEELERSNTSKSSRSSEASHKIALERKLSLTETLSKYKIENMTPEEMHESLLRVEENPVQPFTFLSEFLDSKSSDVDIFIDRNKPTEIDLQLSALKRRVKLNKSLLERTNEHVKEINFLVEKNEIIASRELNCDEINSNKKIVSGDSVIDDDYGLKASCPGIMELQRTIKATKEMLGYVKKICNEEMKMSDLPRELVDHMSVKKEIEMDEKV